MRLAFVSILAISTLAYAGDGKKKKGRGLSKAKMPKGSSNLKTYFREGITPSTQLTTSWDTSPIPVNEKLQKFVFPEGVTFNREKRLF